MDHHGDTTGDANVWPGLAFGTQPAPSWQPVAACELLIFVGLTGVGKSTTIEHLLRRNPAMLLPNRRTLTDSLIIDYVQRRDALPRVPVTDRAERFALTRRYRELRPGGMADALADIYVDRDVLAKPLFFDGLRGENEVTAAASVLPFALFAVLDAPDSVRVQRLLQRNDAFDCLHSAAERHSRSTPGAGRPLQSRGVTTPAGLLSAAEETELVRLLDRGEVLVADLQTKLKIVGEERRNYDPVETIKALETWAPDRTVCVDTTLYSATEAAHIIGDFIDRKYMAASS